MGLIVAVDGGNTKTIAVVADTDGTIRGVATAGCSDIYGARSVEAGLQEVLDDFPHIPAFQRKRERIWISRARKLMRNT